MTSDGHGPLGGGCSRCRRLGAANARLGLVLCMIELFILSLSIKTKPFANPCFSQGKWIHNISTEGDHSCHSEGDHYCPWSAIRQKLRCDTEFDDLSDLHEQFGWAFL